MTTLPNNLTDDDRLVLYLAGELPEPEAAAVRSRLDHDPAARQLAETFGRLDSALRADAETPQGHDVPAPAAARRVAAAHHAIHPPATARRRRWLPPAWTIYPVAAAFVLAGLMGGWWYSVRDEYSRPGTKFVDSSPPLLLLHGRPEQAIEKTSDFDLDWQFMSLVDPGPRGRDSPDRRIEEQLDSLDYLKRVTR